MFAYDNVHSVTVAISDLTADTDSLPIFQIPSRFTKAEIINATAISDTAISGAGTVVQLRLLDYGAAGTAVGGTISAALGASGTGDWTALVPRAFTISEGTIDGGDWVALKYDETGTIAPLNIIVQIDYVNGVGA